MEYFAVFLFCLILSLNSNPSSAEVEILNLFGEVTIETGEMMMMTKRKRIMIMNLMMLQGLPKT